MKTYNVSPYYDDYDEDKKFYQILFNPSRAVQARELTQLQSILRNQIERFGDHIFQHGSIVIPGNSDSELNVPYVRIVKEFGTTQYTADSFIGQELIGGNSAVEAIVRKAVTGDEYITLFLNYTKGSGSSAPNIFEDDEVIFLKSNIDLTAKLLETNSSGYGSFAFVNRGVYYINGTFALVDTQSVVISEDSSDPSCHVLLKIVEERISANDDTTLLDPAQGHYNYTAPGADRLKISLVLTTLPLGSEIDDNYVEIMRYNDGILEEHSRTPKYSELEKSLARRTYDTSGNYLVEGFNHTLREHLKTAFNNGAFVEGDRDKFVIDVTAGRAYIKGLESESIYSKRVVLDKGRTDDHIKIRDTNIKTEYGRYIYVTDLKSLPNFRTRQTVDLYDTSATTDGTKVGSASVVSIDYHVGDAESNSAVYKLYVDSIEFLPTYSIYDVGGLRFGSTGFASVLTKYRIPNATVDYTDGEIINNPPSTKTGTVVRYSRSAGDVYIKKHTHTKPLPSAGDIIVGASSEASSSIITQESMGGDSKATIFEIPVSPLATIKDENNVYDIKYTSWKYISVTTDGSGYAQFTVADGNIVPIEAGTIVAVEPTKIVTRDKISINNNNQLIITGATSNTNVTVLCQVIKTGVVPKTKTLATHTLNGISPSKVIPLTKADVVRVIQVTSGGVDVTNRFSLDNGQTDYRYGIGRLLLTGAMPTSNLTIVFEYFEHSGSGDYFNIDSYKSLGDDYIASAPTYRSITSGRDYDLGNCLDFRPRVGANGSFDSGSPSLIDPPVINTFTTTSAQYYVPRIDVLVLGKGGDIDVLRGTPRDVPKPKQIPDNMIGLAMVLIPAYTVSLSDVRSRSMQKYRYTMDDIGQMEKRLISVEEMSLLNSLETSIISLGVVDSSTGLAKFRAGYLVDNFTDSSTVCDFFNRQNSCKVYRGSMMPPPDSVETLIDILGDSTHLQITGGQVTLPWIETSFITQNVSTRVTNLNPFLVISYDGVMMLDPSFDTWVEIRNLETIFETENKVIQVEAKVTRPAPAPVPKPKPKPIPSKPPVPPKPNPTPPPPPKPAPIPPTPVVKPTYSELRPDVVKAYQELTQADKEFLGKDAINQTAFNYWHLRTYGADEGMIGQYSSYF